MRFDKSVCVSQLLSVCIIITRRPSFSILCCFRIGNPLRYAVQSQVAFTTPKMAERGALDNPNWASTPTPSSRPASTRSARSKRDSSRTSDESTPLLARDNSENRANGDNGERDHSPAASSLLRSLHGKPGARRKWPWPSIIALLLLCAFTVVIMLLGFFVPETMEEYAMQAKEFDIQSISLPEFTATGARARIQGVFWMNAAKVRRKSVRDLGVFGTWLARKVKSEESTVKVFLPDYDNVVLGTANVPAIEIDIQSGHRNDLDFLVDLEPGDVEGIRAVANDWLDGRLEKLTLQGTADVKLRSGILSLGTQAIAQSLVFEGNSICYPPYSKTKPQCRRQNPRNTNIQHQSLDYSRSEPDGWHPRHGC